MFKTKWIDGGGGGGGWYLANPIFSRIVEFLF